MNSINERLRKLERKVVKPRTEKQSRFENFKKQYFRNQGGKCICGYRFTGYDKPQLDFIDFKNSIPRGLLCEQCDQALRCVRSDPEILDKLSKYIRAGGSNNQMLEMFDAGEISSWQDFKWEK